MYQFTKNYLINILIDFFEEFQWKIYNNIYVILLNLIVYQKIIVCNC
jgi:hypothetical protein